MMITVCLHSQHLNEFAFDLVFMSTLQYGQAPWRLTFIEITGARNTTGVRITRNQPMMGIQMEILNQAIDRPSPYTTRVPIEIGVLVYEDIVVRSRVTFKKTLLQNLGLAGYLRATISVRRPLSR